MNLVIGGAQQNQHAQPVVQSYFGGSFCIAKAPITSVRIAKPKPTMSLPPIKKPPVPKNTSPKKKTPTPPESVTPPPKHSSPVPRQQKKVKKTKKPKEEVLPHVVISTLPRTPEQLTLEQEVFCYINLLRTKPRIFIEPLQRLKEEFDKGNRSAVPGTNVPLEDSNSIQEAMDYLQVVTPVKPLTYSAGSTIACREHCDVVGETGVDQSNQLTRMLRYVEMNVFQKHTKYREMQTMCNKTALGILFEVLIDRLEASRKCLMSAEFSVLGCGIGALKTGGTMCTLYLGGGSIKERGQAALKAAPEAPASMKEKIGALDAIHYTHSESL